MGENEGELESALTCDGDDREEREGEPRGWDGERVEREGEDDACPSGRRRGGESGMGDRGEWPSPAL